MKIINVVLIIISILVLVGLFYNGVKEDDTQPINTDSSITDIFSLKTSVVKIENDTILVLDGTVQEELLSSITSSDFSTQTYKITTSDGSKKSKDEIYEYDRLYVLAENSLNEVYYTIMFIDTLD